MPPARASTLGTGSGDERTHNLEATAPPCVGMDGVLVVDWSTLHYFSITGVESGKYFRIEHKGLQSTNVFS